MKGGNSSRSEGDHSASPPPEPHRTTFDWPRDTGLTDAVMQEMEEQVRLRRRRQRRLRGAAGVFVMLLVVGAIWRGRLSPTGERAAAEVVAEAPLPIRQVLPDGSVVLLRSGAAITVDFTATTRRVNLTRGEALFEVTKNMERPFVVRAAGVDVRAVGTAFAVDLKQATVEVLVTEGEVAVEKREVDPPAVDVPATAPASAESDGSARTLTMVSARNRVVVALVTQPAAARPEVIPVSEAELQARLGWRVAILQFSRTPLAEAVERINRHAGTRLILEGEGLETVRLSGAIRADNVDALLELLVADYGIVPERRGGTEIVLRKARR